MSSARDMTGRLTAAQATRLVARSMTDGAEGRRGWA